MTTDLPDKNNMNTFRSGFVAVVGRPNAGKSTLLNTLLGQKVVIISDKPQTTRNRIQCILTEERGQIIFIDTPGIHKPKHRLGEYMVEAAKSALRGVDLALYVVDASVPIGTGDKYVMEIIQASQVPCILALNKIDLLKKGELQQKIEEFSELAEFKHTVPISALQAQNTASLVDMIFAELPEGPMYYPPDEVTDQPERFIVAELIREKLLHLTRDEIPHSVAVLVEQMEEIGRASCRERV